MANENQTWFIDFSEKGQMWHIDLERVPENFRQRYWKMSGCFRVQLTKEPIHT